MAGYVSDDDFGTLFLQVKGLDASYQGLCRTIMSLLDEDTKARIAAHPEVRALQCEVDNFKTGLGAYGRCGFFRLGEPAYPLKSAGI